MYIESEEYLLRTGIYNVLNGNFGTKNTDWD